MGGAKTPRSPAHLISCFEEGKIDRTSSGGAAKESERRGRAHLLSEVWTGVGAENILAEVRRKIMRKLILAALAILSLSSPSPGEDAGTPWALTHRDLRPAVQRGERERSWTVTIPAETEVPAQLLSGIHSRVNHVNDSIQAYLLQPLYVQGRMALPVGTLIDGRITRVQPAGHLHRPAELALRFERITLPDGQAEPIHAVLSGLESSGSPKPRLDPEGFLRGPRSPAWKGLGVGLAGLGVFAAGKIVVGGSSALSPLLPAGGAALLGYEILWPRGQDVHLPPQTSCRIRLSYPVTLRVAG